MDIPPSPWYPNPGSRTGVQCVIRDPPFAQSSSSVRSPRVVILLQSTPAVQSDCFEHIIADVEAFFRMRFTMSISSLPLSTPFTMVKPSQGARFALSSRINSLILFSALGTTRNVRAHIYVDSLFQCLSTRHQPFEMYCMCLSICGLPHAIGLMTSV